MYTKMNDTLLFLQMQSKVADLTHNQTQNSIECITCCMTQLVWKNND